MKKLILFFVMSVLLLSISACTTNALPKQKAVYQAALVQKCQTENLPRLNGLTGTDSTDVNDQWLDIYFKCARIHNGLVDTLQ
ncbi:hypothetical protein EGD17_05605 [Salmonella enterica]|nr:hypothetical protein [Salmonella enterica]ECL8515662.1 hypothetical protein [Salmonella enterica]